MDHHHSSHAGSSKIRRRANKACLACRARKVRCDVSQRGRPCMNCFLDGEACVVIGRASRRRASNNTNTGSGDRSAENAAHRDPQAQEQLEGGRVETPAQPSHAEAVADMLSDHGSENSDSGINSLSKVTAGSTLDSEREFSLRGPEEDSYRGLPPARHGPRHESLQELLHQHAHSSTRARIQQLEWVGEQSMRFGSDVTYSYYPFLEVNNLPSILPQDVSYLEMQGCLRVPAKPILDDFVKQYYLHVHPIMPLVDEGIFWEMYGSQPGAISPKERLSLLVLQAMLFAACSYVPRKSLQTLGFVNVKSAKEALYRQTKLLFDFGAEASPIASAQAALLLSAWSPLTTSECAHASSYWLSVAIQQAKRAGAHRKDHMPDTGVPPHRRVSLKMLWSCIILQDRLLSLCSRRPIQLSKAHYDTDDEWFAACEPGLLWNEAKRGRAYNVRTKATLNAIFSLMVSLALVLTDLLTEVWPLNDEPLWEARRDQEVMQSIGSCKARLNGWYQKATAALSKSQHHRVSTDTIFGDDSHDEFQHESVTLYSNYMYMLYHSALTRLCHHEGLYLIRKFHSTQENSMSLRERALLADSRREMEQAAWAGSQCLKVLVTHRLSRWAPTTSITCISMPLLLCITKAKSLPTPSVEYHRLCDLSEAIKKYQPQPDVEDHLYEATQSILDVALLDDDPTPAAPSSAVARESAAAGGDYNDTISELSLHPAMCLRIALVSGTSRFAGGKEDPASLLRLFTAKNLHHIPSLLRHGLSGEVKSSGATSGRRSPSASKSIEEALRQTVARWTQEDQAVSFGVQLGIVSAQAGGEDGVSEGGPEGKSIQSVLGQVFSEAADTLEGNLLSACVLSPQIARAEEGL